MQRAANRVPAWVGGPIVALLGSAGSKIATGPNSRSANGESRYRLVPKRRATGC
jgi:hypothetical protein